MATNFNRVGDERLESWIIDVVNECETLSEELQESQQLCRELLAERDRRRHA